MPARSMVAAYGDPGSLGAETLAVCYCDAATELARSLMRMCTCCTSLICGCTFAQRWIWRAIRVGSPSAENSSTNFFQAMRVSEGRSKMSNESEIVVAMK